MDINMSNLGVMSNLVATKVGVEDVTKKTKRTVR